MTSTERPEVEDIVLTWSSKSWARAAAQDDWCSNIRLSNVVNDRAQDVKDITMRDVLTAAAL